MFKIVRRLAQNHQPINNNLPRFLSGKQCFNFGQKQQPNNKKSSSWLDQHFSISDIWEKSLMHSKHFYAECRKSNRAYWSLLLFLPLLYYYFSQQNVEEEAINYFQDEVRGTCSQVGQVEVKIGVSQQQPIYKVYYEKNGRKFCVNYNHDAEKLKNLIKSVEQKIHVKYSYEQNYEIKLTLPTIFANLLSVVLIGVFVAKTSSMSGSVKKNTGSNMASNLMNEKKKFQIITKTSVKFQDVAGLDQSKIEVQQFVDFLKNPQKYKKVGARIPKGVLLTGPPGTGKTMLAKACAGQAGVPFIPTSGSDFVEIFVGIGASRIRDLFQTAKDNAPSIIFIDEIDAVGRKRSGSHGSHDERDNTLNQILVEMDGFDTNQSVIVMAATNRQNLLDNALIRPGRFDRIVEVNLPDLEGRRQIFNVHLENIKVESVKTKQDYARRLAALTPGFSGAQIANLCNEAALLAARHNKTRVDSHDFEMATERVIGGIEKRSIISKQQKKIVAVHESGHAVVSWFLEGANPLLKLTIIPRSKGALGFAQYFDDENKLQTKTQLIDRICFILGGRCAEEHFFGNITNGAADDLEKAYKIAHSIVVKLGMNDMVGNIGFKDSEYLRPYSEEMGAQIDKEIINILKECTERTRQMVKTYEKQIKELSDQLFDKETLTIKQIRKILGEREHENNSYRKYLELEEQQSS